MRQLRRGFSVIFSIPMILLGSLQSFARVLGTVVIMVAEIILTILMYQIMVQLLMALGSIFGGLLEGYGDFGVLGSMMFARTMVFVQPIFSMVVSIAVLWIGIKNRKKFIKAVDEIVMSVLDKFILTLGDGTTKEQPAQQRQRGGLAKGIAGGAMGGLMAMRAVDQLGRQFGGRGGGPGGGFDGGGGPEGADGADGSDSGGPGGAGPTGAAAAAAGAAGPPGGAGFASDQAVETQATDLMKTGGGVESAAGGGMPGTNEMQAMNQVTGAVSDTQERAAAAKERDNQEVGDRPVGEDGLTKQDRT